MVVDTCEGGLPGRGACVEFTEYMDMRELLTKLMAAGGGGLPLPWLGWYSTMRSRNVCRCSECQGSRPGFDAWNRGVRVERATGVALGDAFHRAI